MAFIEFGDQGSALDPSQRAAALSVIRKAKRPLLFVYIHGWLNDVNSRDVCRFEHFIDMVSQFPEVSQNKINVIGVYIAWRGRDLTIPGLNLLTFWSRKSAGGQVAAQNTCLATINDLALATHAPGKDLHHCVLMGHSFGGLVLSSTIAHSILTTSGSGVRNASPWDMAVAFNPANNSIGTRQLLEELEYRYRYDPKRHAYVGRAADVEKAPAIDENHPLLVILQSENDQATGKLFPIGAGLADTINLRYHWNRVPVPGEEGEKVSEHEFDTHTPGNNKYLVNFKVEPLGPAPAPPGLAVTANRALEANIRANIRDRTFYTSEKNDGHELKYCKSANYDPSEIRPPTHNELWERWKIAYTGNANVPYWIVRVPKEIISGHGGLWSDNSIALLGAIYRMHFPLNKNGAPVSPQRAPIPEAPSTQ